MATDRKPMQSSPWPWLLSAALATLGLPARGDWLVTRDGQVMEIEGSWAVEGKLVKFTTVGGTLTAIRATEVDLEASREETARRAAPPPPPAPTPPPPAPKRAALVLTDKDVRHVDPEALDAAEPARPGDIIMYITDWCPVCKSARQFFARLGVPVIEKDIEKDPAARAEYARKSGKSGISVPLIDIGGKLSFGLHPDELRVALAERALKIFEAESKAERAAREKGEP